MPFGEVVVAAHKLTRRPDVRPALDVTAEPGAKPAVAARAGGRAWLGRSAGWLAAFAVLTLLVQLHALRALDLAGLSLAGALRDLPADGAMNWLYRIGFVQVDAAIALVWALAAGLRRRSLRAALAPLVLFAVIAAQAGLRLVVDQPPPPESAMVYRPFAEHAVGNALDTTDAAARAAFRSSLMPESAADRGSYPSGHTSRVLFLALLAVAAIRARPGRAPWWADPAAALLLTVSVLVGVSALYFGYHWPSDLVGGYLLALAAFPAAAWLSRTADARWSR